MYTVPRNEWIFFRYVFLSVKIVVVGSKRLLIMYSIETTLVVVVVAGVVGFGLCVIFSIENMLIYIRGHGGLPEKRRS